MPHLSQSFSGALRTFSYWIANGTVGHPMLDDIDYRVIFEEPSALEQVYAIFANVIEMDEDGTVLNAKAAERRAAEYIHSYATRIPMERPLEDWEQALHNPPPAQDIKP